MGTDASWPLQQAVITELTTSEALTHLLGEAPEILDKPQPDGALPRIEIGDSQCKTWRSATFDGQEHEIALHAWTREGGSNASKEIASVIIGHLHDSDLPLPGHALVDLQFESSETRYLQGSDIYHCLLQFSALTVSD